MTVYDKAKWHAEQIPNRPERAVVHIGFFLAWCLHRGFIGSLLLEDCAEELEQFKADQLTGPQFIQALDGVLDSEMLNAEGRAFADASYDDYLDGYEAGFPDLPTMYDLSDNDENLRRVSVIIDRLYDRWTAQPSG